MSNFIDIKGFLQQKVYNTASQRRIQCFDDWSGISGFTGKAMNTFTYINYGKEVLDSFTSAPSSSGWLPEIYIGTENRWEHHDRYYLRKQAEGAQALVLACSFVQAHGLEYCHWQTRAQDAAYNISELQSLKLTDFPGGILFRKSGGSR